ncbi:MULTISPECIES: DUF1294 domain-containing protein [Pseudomonas]|uniref:DUF1294 domain-containing protein n=1 Tax=Pseudomonas TaxID=286 RepID=UPI000A1D90C1|nr:MULTISPECIES: DUF1294 domain-containing protein [Pseudomonas]PNB82904.1 DUF1294 domain-containing protein [Pseudomonas sp. FW305-BF6]MCH4901722.1 DUF1294 domain-containing protein [Pseudomonas sp. B707]PNA06917.1 DUF1294 domain-containing protein [Pseudomonas sp. FW305-BF15]PNB46671.1 DUF1294 domain-containing protein [Pseudomonas sp. GW456-12-10-14-LB2]TEA63586.1 DUF1294 domain-containing protein [Pseudomonas sp. CH235]
MSDSRARRPERGPSGGNVQHLKLKLVVLLIVCALPLSGSLSMWLRGISLVPLTAYGLVSVLAFFLYWADKRKARADAWRTPENILHAVELAGGWPGALIAQQVFRHKTRKVSFQVLFWMIVALHQMFWIDQLFLGSNLLALF